MLRWRGLVRYFVLFVIDLKTRQIEIAGIVASPTGAWMAQIARNLTAQTLTKHTGLPVHWDEQKKRLGFACARTGVKADL